jgi:hypothetical protein
MVAIGWDMLGHWPSGFLASYWLTYFFPADFSSSCSTFKHIWRHAKKCFRRLLTEMKYCEISKEMSSLYFGLAVFCLFETSVSLPQVWFQEIKRMIRMHSTHGLFLTCTLKTSFIFTQCTINRYLHNVNTTVNRTPCRINKNPQLTWRANVLLMVANSHPLWSLAC